jgi:CheY-like chemotaxis protein
VRSYIDAARVASADATSVVRRLREFYRSRDEDEPETVVDLNLLVRQTRDLTRPRWQAQAQAQGCNIQFVAALGVAIEAKGDAAELREVLTNLVFNAVDALPDGGTITVTTFRKDEQVSLMVGDDGEGMTEDVRRRCLEPFFTTKGLDGSGMGLAMAYGTIRRHKGTLEITSALGRGTTVSITLPAASRQTAPETSTAPPTIPARALRILLVEDLPELREIFGHWLVEAGHAVEIARNGREGLEKFLQGWYDVIITDQAMPEMNGEQLALAARRSAPGKPIILLTGFGDLLSASSTGGLFSAILSKPIAASTLVEAVLRAVETPSHVAS